MASIATEGNGRRRILFVDPHDRRRRVVRLGDATMKQAEAFKLRLERLVNARITASLDADTAKWLADLPDAMHAKLAAVGLAEERDVLGRVGLDAFTGDYLASAWT